MGAALPRPRDHLPAEPDRLGAGAGRGGRAGPAGGRGRAGRGAAGGPGGGQGAVRAVLHPTRSATLPEATSDPATVRAAALDVLELFTPPPGPAARRPRRVRTLVSAARVPQAQASSAPAPPRPWARRARRAARAGGEREDHRQPSPRAASSFATVVAPRCPGRPARRPGARAQQRTLGGHPERPAVQHDLAVRRAAEAGADRSRAAGTTARPGERTRAGRRGPVARKTRRAEPGGERRGRRRVRDPVPAVTRARSVQPGRRSRHQRQSQSLRRGRHRVLGDRAANGWVASTSTSVRCSPSHRGEAGRSPETTDPHLAGAAAPVRPPGRRASAVTS